MLIIAGIFHFQPVKLEYSFPHMCKTLCKSAKLVTITDEGDRVLLNLGNQERKAIVCNSIRKECRRLVPLELRGLATLSFLNLVVICFTILINC